MVTTSTATVVTVARSGPRASAATERRERERLRQELLRRIVEREIRRRALRGCGR